MANDYIFGPFETTSPKYQKAFDHANWWLRQGNANPLEQGQTVTISKGELDPSVEQAFLGDKEKSKPKEQPNEQKKSQKTRTTNYGRWEMLNNWVDYGQHYFSMSAGRVWFTIFRLADGKDNTVKLGVRALACHAGVGKNTAQRAISAFEKAGILVCIYKSQNKGVPSKYRLVDATNELTRRPAKPR